MRKRDFVLCLISGLLLALSFPPLKMGFLAYVGLVPFLWALRGKPPRDAAFLGFLMGLAFHGAAFYWIFIITVLGGTITVLVYALHVALFALMFRAFVQLAPTSRLRSEAVGLWAAPLLWTAMEYLHSFGALGFPWATLGYTQSAYLPLIQHAEATSVFGVTCWVVAVNLVAYRLLEALPHRKRAAALWGIAAALLFALPYAHGRWAMRKWDAAPASGTRLKIAVVQPNIGPREKWDNRDLSLQVLPQLTRQAAEHRPDLVVWPETAMPYFLLEEPGLAKRVQLLADSLHVSILTGALGMRFEPREIYNAAFLFVPRTREVQQYHKINLVPMSERVPFNHILPSLADLTMGRAGSFSPGRQRTIFHLPAGRFGTLICYESIFPDIARSFAAAGAQFLVIITNDAWFGPWSSASQHARMATFRAVEQRIPIARSANTGISTFVDPCGRMLGSLGLSVRGITTREVSLRQGRTFFGTYGNVFAQACVGAVLAGLIWCLVQRPRRRRRA